MADDNPQVIRTDGPGDVNNFFPLSVGDMWGFHVTGYETGQQAVDFMETIKVSGTKLVSGNTAYVMTSSRVDNPGESGEEYFLKNDAAVYYLGDNSPGYSFPVTPYPIIKFPASENTSFLQVNKAGIDYGEDLDGDGRNESLAIYSRVTVAGSESVTVEAGTIQNCTKFVTSITETLTASRDQRQAVANATISEWYAPGLGLVKKHAEYSSPGWSKVTDYSLASYAVEGRKSDTTPPAIVSVQPSAGSTVGAASSIQAVFSEEIDLSSINAATFVLTDANNQLIPGAVSYASKTATFIPAAPLTSGIYTATVTTAVQDKLANPLAANYSWSFTLDNTAPYITATSPAVNAANVPISASISATFSEPLAGYTVDYYSFSVKDSNNTEVFGRVSSSNNVVTVTPYQDLSWNTTYTATVTTAIRDTAGNSMASNYSWSFSTPPGQFLSPISIPIGSMPAAVAIGDVNGDGRNDVVVVTTFYNNPARDGKVLVFLQNAAGGLDPPIVYDTSGTYANSPQTVAIGDVNHDGRNDVIVGNSGMNIEIFLQNAAGTLDPGVTYATSDSNKIRIADMNNDGLLDIVGIGPGNNTASIWYQNGNGTLNAPVTYSVPHTGWYDDLALGDVNNDGLKDIIVMSSNSPRGISVLTQRADNSFNPAVGYSAASPWGIAVGDLNGDNTVDLVSTSGGGGQFGSQIAVYLQNGQGTFSLPNYYDSYYSVGAVAIADLNNDGRNDIIVQHNGYSTIGIYLQSADGTFQSEDRYRAPSTNFNPQAMGVGDINGDGLLDVVTVDTGGLLAILYHKPAPSISKASARKSAAMKSKVLPFRGVSLRRF